MTEPLSPAAQAILAAVTQQMYACDPEDLPNESVRVAYTLRLGFRAMADAVVPEENSIVTVNDFRRQRQHTRKQILGIATELENHEH